MIIQVSMDIEGFHPLLHNYEAIDFPNLRPYETIVFEKNI